MLPLDRPHGLEGQHAKDLLDVTVVGKSLRLAVDEVVHHHLVSAALATRDRVLAERCHADEILSRHAQDAVATGDPNQEDALAAIKGDPQEREASTACWPPQDVLAEEQRSVDVQIFDPRAAFPGDIGEDHSEPVDEIEVSGRKKSTSTMLLSKAVNSRSGLKVLN